MVDSTTLLWKGQWTVEALLTAIAGGFQGHGGSQNRHYYSALIDTGALITGMSNQQVAQFILENSKDPDMEGVVYLRNSDDEQMILLRGSPNPMKLKECGVAKEKRFTFYDQVHTGRRRHPVRCVQSRVLHSAFLVCSWNRCQTGVEQHRRRDHRQRHDHARCAPCISI